VLVLTETETEKYFTT